MTVVAAGSRGAEVLRHLCDGRPSQRCRAAAPAWHAALKRPAANGPVAMKRPAAVEPHASPSPAMKHPAAVEPQTTPAMKRLAAVSTPGAPDPRSTPGGASCGMPEVPMASGLLPELL